jgi:hypothetical protein
MNCTPIILSVGPQNGIDCLLVSEHELQNSLVIEPPCFDELRTGATKDVSLLQSSAEFCESAERKNEIAKWQTFTR